MKKYEVLISFNSKTGRDVRVRCDIDKHRGFTRLTIPNMQEKLVVHKSFSSGNERLFMVAFEGNERDAKRFAEMLKLGYDGLGVPRSILCQVEV